MNETTQNPRTLQTDQDEAIARLWGAALLDDPLAQFACPDPEMRAIWLPTSFLGLLNMEPTQELLLGAGEPLAGVVMARRFLDRAEVEASPPEVMHPLDERLFRQIEAAESQIHDASPGPHWFLDVIGVQPSHQGQGIGRSLIQRVIVQADDEKLPILLVTWQPRNLAFYRKQGFEVVCQGEGPAHGPHWWGCVRPSP
jgi:ribosomal protein S18 acetylase RimI-like enzyme